MVRAIGARQLVGVIRQRTPSEFSPQPISSSAGLGLMTDVDRHFRHSALRVKPGLAGR